MMSFNKSQSFVHLKDLCSLHGASGQEEIVVSYLDKKFQDLGLSTRKDSLSNIFAYKKGTSASPLKISVSAHSDEVGFLVCDLQENGLLELRPLGGYKLDALLGSVWVVKTLQGSFKHGVVAFVDKSKDSPYVLLDVGAHSLADLQKEHIEIGNTVVSLNHFVYEPSFHKIFSKALDNRASCALILDLAQKFSKKPYVHDLFLGATSQEELGLRGAKTAVALSEPDIALILECSPVLDVYNKGSACLGGGPLIRVADRAMVFNQEIVQLCRDLCHENEIPHQLYVSRGGTDAIEFQTYKRGVLTCVLAIPCRYMHTGASMIDSTDYLRILKLTLAFLHHLEKIGSIKELLHKA